MIIIGLTGGVGMGKSTTAEYLEKRGFPVIDTDQLARELVQPGQPALEEITKAFGNEMLASDGGLQRGVLARVVFADAAARHRLEGILHPRIRQKWQVQVEAYRAAGREAVVVVIPLLFETQAESSFDWILCAACSSRTQLARLQQRGWTPSEIEQRIAAQWPIEKKMLLSHYVLWTEAGFEVHQAQLSRILLQAGLAPPDMDACVNPHS